LDNIPAGDLHGSAKAGAVSAVDANRHKPIPPTIREERMTTSIIISPV
jgi:hypothetical protein